jgi:GxxExxY protein
MNDLTEQVLAAVFEVSNTLGAGFLEKVYRRALLHELRLRKIRAAPMGQTLPAELRDPGHLPEEFVG